MTFPSKTEGIGEYIAYAYATAGASGIIIAARRKQLLEEVAMKMAQIPGDRTVKILTCDVTSSTSIANLANECRTAFGRLDTVICNPAYAGPVTLHVTEGKPSWFQSNFDVNVIGTYHAAHYLIPLLLESETGAKCFIAIGSFAGCITDGPIAYVVVAHLGAEILTTY